MFSSIKRILGLGLIEEQVDFEDEKISIYSFDSKEVASSAIYIHLSGVLRKEHNMFFVLISHNGKRGVPAKEAFFSSTKSNFMWRVKLDVEVDHQGMVHLFALKKDVRDCSCHIEEATTLRHQRLNFLLLDEER